MQTIQKKDQAHPWQIKVTPKYKDITLILRMQLDLSVKHASLAALYMVLIEDRNTNYPTKAKMLQAQDELYGATFSSGVIGYHNQMIIQCASKIIDQSYVDESNLYQKHSEWFESMIFNPMINEETLKEAKQVVSDSLLRDLDQPSKYAQIKAFEQLGQGESLAINMDGDRQTIQAIRVKEMLEFVAYLKDEAFKMVYLIGNLSDDQTSSYQNLYFKDQKFEPLLINPIEKADLGLVVERKKIGQSHLLRLYQSQIAMNHPLYLANRLAVIMLGQLPTSYLFTEIREKRSLAYSISASYIAFDGVIMVKTGIDQSNLELVSGLIDEQIEALQQDNDHLLNQAKLMLINAIHNSEDNINSYINLHYSYFLIQSIYDKEALIQAIHAVDMQSIKQAVQHWQPLLSYALTGEDYE